MSSVAVPGDARRKRMEPDHRRWTVKIKPSQDTQRLGAGATEQEAIDDLMAEIDAP